MTYNQIHEEYDKLAAAGLLQFWNGWRERLCKIHGVTWRDLEPETCGCKMCARYRELVGAEGIEPSYAP